MDSLPIRSGDNGAGGSLDETEDRPKPSRPTFADQIDELGVGEDIAVLVRSRWGFPRIAQYVQWQWGIRVDKNTIANWAEKNVDPESMGPKMDGLRARLEENTRIVDAMAEQTALIELQWQRLAEGRKNEEDAKALNPDFGKEIDRLDDLLKNLVELQRSYNLFPTLKSVQTFFGRISESSNPSGGSVIAAHLVKEQLMATGMGEMEAHDALMKALVGPERIGLREVDADVIDAQAEAEEVIESAEELPLDYAGDNGAEPETEVQGS